MSISIRTRVALTLTVLVALLAAADARASSYYEASPAGPITASTGAMRFSAGGINVECAVTLSGSIPAGTLEGTPGAEIGRMTSGTMPSCSGGALAVPQGLPWRLEYESALGVLPLLTGLRLRLNRLAVAVTYLGLIRCEYSGVVPLLLALTGSGPLQTGALSVVSGAQLPLVTGAGCPTSGTIGGTLSFTRQAIQVNPSWVVSMGDSFISGEAGRWAGNTTGESGRIDALGPTAYFDNDTRTAETIERCHRSRSAEIDIGIVPYAGFACSGAKTYSFWAQDPIVPTRRYQKPGMDWTAEGISGQVNNLRHWLELHRHGVRMIVISIGGNDFNFKNILQQCLVDYLTPVLPGGNRTYCSQRPELAANFSIANQIAVQERIEHSIRNVRQVMFEKGFPDGSYRILVQNYPSPLPEAGGDFRYPETLARQTTGGCGIYNLDAQWANTVALATINANVSAAMTASNLGNMVALLDVSAALRVHRLCERQVALLDEINLQRWSDNLDLSANSTEWVNQIRTVETAIEPYYLQEGLHPNYWGQLALRNCVRLAYNGGNIRGGRCTYDGPGLNNANPREPLMRLD